MRKFPQKTISRAFVYLRALDTLIYEGVAHISSHQLGMMTGFSDAQIRKDISIFGRVGRPRIGYDTQTLKKLLEDFIAQHVVHVVLFGVGNLGSAILQYPGFHEDKVKIVAAFDRDEKKTGAAINRIMVYAVDKAPEVIPKKHIEIGVIATPKQASQQTADLLVACGVKGIINFSPTTVTVPKDVCVKNIDLAVEFLSLFYDMKTGR